MNPLFSLGKVLIIIGLVIAGIGILLVLTPTTCIIISIILTLLFYLFRR
ncbi:MAG: hypothetical protein JRI58_12350 [Deltaproteobacteria bacterium]|nr:hypothetical protein [Deltaproteobacteria bacterium]